jgi:hypothetical protein
MLTDQQQTDILKTFPNFELSYATITHKNVFSCNIVSAIPEGNKIFVWFVIKNGKNLCVFVEMNQGVKKIIHIFEENYKTTNNNLYQGSIFYGTIIFYNENPFFSIEDIYSLEGKNISFLGLTEKYKLLEPLFYKSSFETIMYNNKQISFGVPLFYNAFSREMNSSIQNLPYKVKEIHFHKSHKSRNYFSMKYTYRNSNTEIKTNINTSSNTRLPREIIFLVKPDIQNDIYHLHAFDDNTGKEYFYDVAYISDYKTSVTMNSLFRTIKENINLDALEESDDEDEFQNESIDKYVDLKKSYYMVCTFNYKFKKWMPLRVKENATTKDLIKRNDLLRLEKNRY